jgi:hypothetical protein
MSADTDAFTMVLVSFFKKLSGLEDGVGSNNTWKSKETSRVLSFSSCHRHVHVREALSNREDANTVQHLHPFLPSSNWRAQQDAGGPIPHKQLCIQYLIYSPCEHAT